MLLEKYAETARRAYMGTSFTPDVRGQQTIKDWSDILRQDLARIPEDEQEQYRQRFERLFSNWLHAKGRCISSMITGPARFPTARAEKWRNAERKHYEKLESFRERAQKAIERRNKVKRTPLSEYEEVKLNLENRIKTQEIMTAANKLVRAYGKLGEENYLKGMAEIGLKEDIAKELLKPDYVGRIGFPDYKFTNNGAQIRRLRQRLAELEIKNRNAQDNDTDPEVQFNGGRVLMNTAEDRIQVFHDEKPDFETRDKLKKTGFNWSPANGCWQRKITSNAIWATSQMLGLNLDSFTRKLR